jgi:hypothetical protein
MNEVNPMSEMQTKRYPDENLENFKDEYGYTKDDDGTMPSSRDNLEKAVIGHKIVEVKHGTFRTPTGWGYLRSQTGLALLLDNGTIVWMKEEGDCCAYTNVDPSTIIKHIDQIDHVITGVGTTDGFDQWHIYADLGDILEFGVDWSCGNPFYYGYGFTIEVYTPQHGEIGELFKELTP